MRVCPGWGDGFGSLAWVSTCHGCCEGKLQRNGHHFVRRKSDLGAHGCCPDALPLMTLSNMCAVAVADVDATMATIIENLGLAIESAYSADKKKYCDIYTMNWF